MMSQPTTAATARWLRSASAARKGLILAAFLNAIQTHASTARSSSSGRNSPSRVKHGLAVLRGARRQLPEPAAAAVKPASDPVHDGGEGVSSSSSLPAK